MNVEPELITRRTHDRTDQSKRKVLLWLNVFQMQPIIVRSHCADNVCRRHVIVGPLFAEWVHDGRFLSLNVGLDVRVDRWVALCHEYKHQWSSLWWLSVGKERRNDGLFTSNLVGVFVPCEPVHCSSLQLDCGWDLTAFKPVGTRIPIQPRSGRNSLWCMVSDQRKNVVRYEQMAPFVQMVMVRLEERQYLIVVHWILRSWQGQRVPTHLFDEVRQCTLLFWIHLASLSEAVGESRCPVRVQIDIDYEAVWESEPDPLQQQFQALQPIDGEFQQNNVIVDVGKAVLVEERLETRCRPHG